MAETVAQAPGDTASTKQNDTIDVVDLSTERITKRKRRRKDRPPSQRNGQKHKLGHGRSADPQITPASFAEMVRHRTRNGTRVLNRLLDVLDGVDIDQSKIVAEKEGGVYLFRYRAPADVDQMLMAAKILLERGWGKAVERVLVDDIRQPFQLISIYGPGLDPLTNGELKRRKELPPPKPEDQQG